jgi:endonuclease/exonuclease/phosphatase family metal-dependent hydrolase
VVCGWQPRTAGEDGIEIDVLATHLEHRNEKVRLQQLIQCLSHVSPSRYNHASLSLSLVCVAWCVSCVVCCVGTSDTSPPSWTRPHLLMGDLNAFSKDDYSYRHWLVRLATFTRRLPLNVCVCVCTLTYVVWCR